MKLAAAMLKLKKCKDKTKQLRGNTLFQKCYKHFYDSLRSDAKIVTDPPAEENDVFFWTGFCSYTSTHNNEAAWLQV
eukprot:9317362-Ditylum_brightwellii.AAC.1